MTSSGPSGSPTVRIPSVAILGLIAAMGPLALSIHVQSIPAIAASFGVSYAEAQMTVSAFLATFAVTQLVVGPLSDKLGRKPVLYAGLLTFGLASVLAASADSMEILIVARMLQGAGGCATLVTPRAVVQDIHQGTEAARIMAFVAMLQSSAPPIAPVIGAGLDAALDWRAIFWFLAAITVALALAITFWMGETRERAGANAASWGEIFVRYARLLGSRLYIGYTLAFTFGTSGFFAYLAVGPGLLIETRGLAPHWFSLSLALTAIQFPIANYLTSLIVRRLGVDRLIAIGAVGVTVAGVLLLALAELASPLAIILPVVLYAVFNGVLFPHAMTGATGVDRRVAGSAASFLGFSQIGVGAIAAFALSHLPTDSVVPLAVALTAFGALAILGIVLVYTARRPAPA